LDLSGTKWREAGENCIMRGFMTCTLHQMLLGRSIKQDGVGDVCSTHGINAYKILVGNPERKRTFGRTRLRWEGNIAMDLREIE